VAPDLAAFAGQDARVLVGEPLDGHGSCDCTSLSRGRKP
jgi:hypothetical protein